MCNNCGCSNIDLCSIVGMQPVGFCCSKCELDIEIEPYCANATEIKVGVEGGAYITIKKAPSQEKEAHPEIQN